MVAAVLLLGACRAGPAGGVPRSPVDGVVFSAPSCPVERAGVPCPPRRVSGAVVVAATGGHEIARTRTDRHGRFRLELPRGTYLIAVTTAGGYVSRAARTVVVGAGPTSVRLTVDSGIR